MRKIGPGFSFTIFAAPRPRCAGTFGGRNMQRMPLKVELDLEDARCVGNWTRRQPAGVDIQGDMPPMIHGWGERHADLANNLRPHVEGAIGRLPFV